jgi:hypothetical protein
MSDLRIFLKRLIRFVDVNCKFIKDEQQRENEIRLKEHVAHSFPEHLEDKE